MSTGPCCSLYQSPIDLKKCDISFNIAQEICLKGKNKGAVFNPNKKIYTVNDKVILKVDERKYRLVEYHFHHFPNNLGCDRSEHALDGKKYDAEIHYVFQELLAGTHEHRNNHAHIDVCSGTIPDSTGNLLVIGRFIKFSTGKDKNLLTLQPELPHNYFEYDGALTGESSQGVVDCAPVRWVVGPKPLCFLESQFTKSNTKTTRCLQPLDGRLLLFSCQ